MDIEKMDQSKQNPRRPDKNFVENLKKIGIKQKELN